MKRTFPRPLTRVVTLTGALCATSTPAADLSEIEDRLQRLESQLKSMAEENAELRKQLNWDGKKSLNFIEDEGKAASVAIGGYIQVQGEVGDSPDQRFTGNNENDGFKVRRARLNATGKFLEHFDFKIEGDYGGRGSAMRTQLTDGYINWNRYELLNIKAGQYKTHFGYEQLTSDTSTLTVERSYPSDLLTVGRQIGASITGSMLEKRLSYAAGLFNGNNVNNGFNDGDNFMGTARIGGKPLQTKLQEHDVTLGVGVNGLVSRDTSVSVPGFDFRTNPTGAANNLFAGSRAGVGVDGQLRLGPFGLLAEVLYVQFETDDGNLTPTPDDDDFGSLGFSVVGTYDLVPKKLMALVRYEKVNTEDDVGGSDAESVTGGLTYFVKGSDVKLVANYLYGHIEDADWESRFLSQLQIAF